MENQKRLTELVAQTKEFRNKTSELDELPDLYEDPESSVDPDVDKAKALMAEAFNAYQPLARGSAKLIPSVLDEAETMRKRDSTYSTYAGRVSTGLYTVGWSLALSGRLYGGVETMGAE